MATGSHLLYFFFFLGLHLQHMEITRLWVQSEQHLQACTTATGPSCICYLHRSSWQRQVLNPLSEARD